MTGVLQMLLASGGTTTVNFTSQTVTISAFANSTATYKLTTVGSARAITISDGSEDDTFLEQGIDPSGATSNYEVFASSSVGVSSGTLNTWLALTSDRSWSASQSGSGQNLTFVEFQIRPIGTSSTIDSWGVTLGADVI